jgi:uncharacterized membrane protein YagU involved in acid resistance
MPTPMIDPVAATVAAVVAAQLMEAPAYLQRALGMPVRQDIFDEGGWILRAPARWRRLAGWLGHAALAIAIVLLFATFFAAVARNDHLAGWGIFTGAVHGLLGGLVVGALVDLHPRMPEPVPAPGVFYRHYGRRDVVTFVAGHLWFGFAGGAVRAPARPAPALGGLLICRSPARVVTRDPAVVLAPATRSRAGRDCERRLRRVKRRPEGSAGSGQEQRNVALDMVLGALAGAPGVWVMDRVGRAMYDREDPAALAQEDRARPGGRDVAHAMVAKAGQVTGADMPTEQPNPAGIAVHYGLGMLPGALYGAARHEFPALRAGNGALYGLGLFVMNDEMAAPLLGVASGPGAYPWHEHARGLISHVLLGVVTESVLKLFDRVR